MTTDLDQAIEGYLAYLRVERGLVGRDPAGLSRGPVRLRDEPRRGQRTGRPARRSRTATSRHGPAVAGRTSPGSRPRASAGAPRRSVASTASRTATG